MMVDRGIRSILTLLFVSVFSLTNLPRPVLAQPPQGVVNVFVPADRSLRQHLLRASKAIQEERFSDAVSELGILLASPPNGNVSTVGEATQDFFLEAAAQAGSRTSVKTEAERLLGTLPPKGRELYELQFGAAARAMLEQAIQESNIEKLHEVTRRYFLTKAGGEAALLLGRLYLDSGRPLAAALCLKRLADHPSVATEFDPELSVLLSACWYQARQPEKAQQVLESLYEREPRVQLKIGGQDAEPLPSSDRTLEWLSRHFGANRSRETQLDQWLLFRGNESRNAESRGGLPLEGFRWRQRLAGSPKDQQLIGEIQQNFNEQGMPAVPALQPVAVDNVLLMRTPDLLLAIDMETGKVIWPYPWDDIRRGDEKELTTQSASGDRNGRKDDFAQRIWQDSPNGQVASDGEFIYLLAEYRQSVIPRPFIGRRAPMMQLQDVDAHNELVALELKREGALKWKVGGEAGGEEPLLAGALFLGPPLPLFGQLYVLVEMHGEIRLVVLDPQSGRQRWSQQLAHLESSFGADLNTRRFAGATPSFADGVLVCPTTCGAVVGVDVAARRLLWGYQYSQNVGIQSFPFSQPMMGYSVSTNRWIDSTATIADGCVVLTPPESESLICLDLLTGQPRWPTLTRQGELADMMYVACVYDGKIVLVGKSRVTSINLSDGKAGWKQSLALQAESGEMASGRGFLAEGFYYLPTTASQLVKVDLKKGTVVNRVATDQVLGNLICFKDDVISLSPDGVTTYYQIDPLRARVAKVLEKNPDDAWALARHGELLVHDGQHAEALTALQRAHKLAPNDQGVHALLVQTFLTALRQDFARHRGLASEIEPLIENEQQRIDYLLMIADGCRGAGELLNAAESYAKLASLVYSLHANDGEPLPMIIRSGSWSVRLDRFISARLHELYESGDSAVQERLDRLVSELGNMAKDRGAADLESFLQLCGFHPASSIYRLNLATRFVEGGRLLEAELMLAPIDGTKDAGVTRAAETLRARLLTQTKDAYALAATFDRLRKQWPDEPVVDGKTGLQLYAEAVAKGQLKPDANSDLWPWGRAEIQESTDVSKTQQGYRRAIAIPVIQQENAEERIFRVIADGNLVFVRDGNGEIILRFTPIDQNNFLSSPNVNRAEVDGHLLWLNLGGTISAISLLGNRVSEEGALLWRESLLPVPPEASNMMPRPVPKKIVTPFTPQAIESYHFEDGSNKPIAVSGPMNRVGVCFQKVRSLSCVDPLNGKSVWSRNDLEPGMELLGDARFVVAIPQGSTEAVLIDMVDGRSLGKRTVPPLERRWAACGTRILTWDDRANEAEAPWRVHLWDVEKQQDVWSETFSKDSRGCLVENHSVAMLQPDGRFVVRSLHDDRVLVDSRIEPGLPVESILVRASRDSFLVVINDNQPLQRETDAPRLSTSNMLSYVNGRIFAFSRADGSPLWQSPAVVRGYYLLTEQPEDAPSLWLVRPIRQGPIGQQTSRTDLLCLERRTGSMLVDRRDIATQVNSLEVVTNVAKHEVTLILPQIMFTLRFTDQPRPPEPPLQVVHRLPSLNIPVQRVLREVLGNLTDAINKTSAAPAVPAGPPTAGSVAQPAPAK